jgi:transcriptional regulator with XRE-family HTH domain
MKRNVESNLGYLMRILNISGKELAKAIHVDVSLVSKWKTKKRKIINESQYFALLVNYIFQRSLENQHHILKKALLKFNYQLDYEEGLKEAIGDFILKENYEMLNNPLNIILPSNPSEAVYDYNYRIFKGNEGRRQAVIQFFDKILSYEEPTTVLSFSQEDMSWLVEDPAYTKEWLIKFRAILDKGNHVKMIHFVDRNVSKISEVISYWVNLYTHPNIESYYYAKYSDVEFQVTVLVEGSRLGIYGNQVVDDDADQRYTAYYEDNYTVSMFKRLFDRYLSHARPFIKNYSPEEYHDIIKGYSMDGEAARISFLSPNPHTSLMSEDHLRKLLDRYDINKKQMSEMMQYHRYFRSRLKSGFRGILSYDILREGFALGEIYHESLSMCLGKRITLNKEDLKELLNEIKYLNSLESCEIVLMENNSAVFNNRMNIIIDHGRMVMSYSSENTTHISVAEEATTILSFERYYSEVWNRIPRVNKDIRDFEEKIERLLS